MTTSCPTILIPVPGGELLDRLSILEIKSERLTTSSAVANVRRELGVLREAESLALPHPEQLSVLRAELKAVNESLWEIEDSIRIKEHRGEFDDAFVELARSVYRRNDERAALKRALSLAMASELIEEKSYAAYSIDTGRTGSAGGTSPSAAIPQGDVRRRRSKLARFGRRLEASSRAAASSLLGRFLPPGGQASLDSLNGIGRVLLVRPNFRMGNTLLVTPAVHAVRDTLPAARIGVVTTSAYDCLLRHHPDIAALHPLDRRMIWNPFALVSLLRGLRRARYDLAIDCSGGSSLLGAFCAVASGARYRLCSAESDHASLFNLHVSVPHESVHRIDRLCDLLAGIGLHTSRRGMAVHLSPDERARALAARQGWFEDPDADCVGINPGARGDKRWPIGRFEALIEALVARGRQVVLFVGPEERDTLARLRAVHAGHVRIDTTSEPREFAARLSVCKAFVTCDTGPMHLAAAVETPTVSIFLKANSAAYRPQGPAHLTLQDESDGVSVERVLTAVERLSGDTSPSWAELSSRPSAAG